MTGQPYAVRFSAPAAKVLTTLPDTQKTPCGTSWTPPRPTPGASGSSTSHDPAGEDVRHATVGQLSLTYWVNRPLRHLSVLTITWLG
ncbi:hypothetical protein [Streptomyces sp. NPDC058620]|uniref:hypothetical protein n=1 Tax=Streptomyces sp. NPDC058620 TaxID=3346560 RepID=UPI0036683A36